MRRPDVYLRWTSRKHPPSAPGRPLPSQLPGRPTPARVSLRPADSTAPFFGLTAWRSFWLRPSFFMEQKGEGDDDVGLVQGRCPGAPDAAEPRVYRPARRSPPGRGG